MDIRIINTQPIEKLNLGFLSPPSYKLSTDIPCFDPISPSEKKHRKNELLDTSGSNLSNDSLAPWGNKRDNMIIYPISAGFTPNKIFALDSIPDKSKNLSTYKVFVKKRTSDKRYHSVKGRDKNIGLKYKDISPKSQLLYSSQAVKNQIGFTPPQLLLQRYNDKLGVLGSNIATISSKNISMTPNLSSPEKDREKDDKQQKLSVQVGKITGFNLISLWQSIESTNAQNEIQKQDPTKLAFLNPLALRSKNLVKKSSINQRNKTHFTKEDSFYTNKNLNITQYSKVSGFANTPPPIIQKEQEKIGLDVNETFYGQKFDINPSVGAKSVRSKSLPRQNKVQSQIGSYRNSALQFGRKTMIGYSILGDESKVNDKFYRKLVHKLPASDTNKITFLKFSEKEDNRSERNYLDKFLDTKFGADKLKDKGMLNTQQINEDFDIKNIVQNTPFKLALDASFKIQDSKLITALDFREQESQKKRLPILHNGTLFRKSGISSNKILTFQDSVKKKEKFSKARDYSQKIYNKIRQSIESGTNIIDKIEVTNIATNYLILPKSISTSKKAN